MYNPRNKYGRLTDTVYVRINPRGILTGSRSRQVWWRMDAYIRDTRDSFMTPGPKLMLALTNMTPGAELCVRRKSAYGAYWVRFIKEPDVES